MTLDAYSLCPGGTGKKIKHCACRDITGDLEKIIRALEGNQRLAALDRINRVLATKASRPCLLAMKVTTLLGLNELQDLEETVATFLQVAPGNPLAHAFAAILEVRKNHVAEAVDRLQTGLALVEETFPGELYDALGAVAEALAAERAYVAARGHLLFRAMIGSDDEDAIRPLMALTSAASVPVLLKRDLVFDNCPDDVPWQERFTTALMCCARGAWKMGLAEFEAIDGQFPSQPAVLKNIAMARSYLADSGAAEAWHAFAMLDGVPFDEAVSAEAFVHLIDYGANQKTVASTKVTLTIADANELTERLLSCKAFVAEEVDPTARSDDGSPPPKGIFRILSKPLPADDDTLSLDNVPVVLGLALLFGKQTDRDARLELLAIKNLDFDRARTVVNEVAGELITGEESEEILGTVSALEAALSPNLRFPDTASIVVREQLTREALSAATEHVWPTMPLAALDDKSPEQVAGDPAYRIRLAAVILVFEQMCDIHQWLVDANALRCRLGVPALEPIELGTTRLGTLGPEDWSRVVVETLSDEQLLELYQRAAAYQVRTALVNVSKELLKRDSVDDKVDKAALCGSLSRLSIGVEEAVPYLVEARRLAIAAGKSPAQFLLAEFPLRLLRAELDEAKQILTLIQTRHIREPGVADSLYKILVQFGMVSPEGGVPAEPVAAEPPAAPEDKIWTPGDPSEPESGEQQESKLWVPGMD